MHGSEIVLEGWRIIIVAHHSLLRITSAGDGTNLKNENTSMAVLPKFDIKLDKIGIQFKNDINYKNPLKLGSLVISNYGKN